MSRFDHMHFSEVSQFEQCQMKWKYQYQDRLETIENTDANNPLKLGLAIHRGIEVDKETAIKEYLNSYPIITDEHINEIIKLEWWIDKVKDILSKGLHEIPMMNNWYEGCIDFLEPVTKHDLELPHGQFDLYDFKYSNNIDHYMESKQLHVYKYFFEKITGKRIRNMYFLFIPKLNIKQKKTETLFQFRERIQEELKKLYVQDRLVPYEPEKVNQFMETCMEIKYIHRVQKNESYLCNWCEYKDYCQKGDKTMLLPSSERRPVGKTTKHKLIIYGAPFSGKTTFLDKAPNPLNLNTDGNVEFVTMPYISIKDGMNGRQKVLAWEVFKDTLTELEKKNNDFKTIIIDLVDDIYQMCRLYMYNKLGIDHESDDSFKAWDKVRTEFLSTMRRFFNLDYENLIIISHEDTSKDITKKSGDKITSIRPNISEKVVNKLAGMVDIVARVIVEEDETRTLNFKSNEVIFGGGRLKGIKQTSIPLDWDNLMQVYDDVNADKTEVKEEPSQERVSEKIEEETEVKEEPKRTRRTRKVRKED